MTINSSVQRARDLLLTGGGAILVALAATACTTQTPAAAPTPTSTPPATPTTTSSASSASSASKPATPPAKKFANTRNFAQLVGYDPTNRMIEFRVVIRYPNAEKQDDYGLDPHDSAVHRLALAPHATVNGIGNGGSQICQNPPCTTDQLIAAASHPSPASLIAQLIVDSDDTITMVNEQIGAPGLIGKPGGAAHKRGTPGRLNQYRAAPVRAGTNRPMSTVPQPEARS